ncbi:MAG TPA: DUF389 domain-containing protein [Polyangiaceae bacterium]|nr:DUF389 domain-containing protein [Polyangiaceae bacterium]
MSPTPASPIPRLQNRLLHLLGSDEAAKPTLVAAMLRRDASESTSYWLQLVVSVGIATLGLVVGSTAVVIGAMLVAPLMGPIIGLAMGLATGSPFLVLRSAGRIGLSVLVSVGGAALITVLLPFHELNAEISARTSPTVLDLITAGFCALAGVYASLRQGSDTTATAAGTSISISLVPPLCASGYGLGIATWRVAGGAGLLFLTNLVAIVVVGTMAFVAAGFNRVQVGELERTELERGSDAPIARALARRLARLFESRGGPVLRFLMPFVLLAAVYVPLRQALDEVAWQVRVRAAVQETLAREPNRVVQSRTRVERREVEVAIVLLGKAEDAERARARIDADVRQVAGVKPRVEVLAVPDATALEGLESSLLPRPLAPAAAKTPAEELDSSRGRVRQAVLEVWPRGAAGEPLAIDLGAAAGPQLQLRVAHLGPPLGAAAREAVGRAAELSLGQPVELIDVAIPAELLTRADGDLAFISRAAAGAQASASVAAIAVCATVVPAPPRSAERDLARALDAALAGHPRVTSVTGKEWSVQFVRGACPRPTEDAGASDAAADAPR